METIPVPSHKEVVEQMLEDLKKEVVSCLPSVGVLAGHQLAVILLVYRNVFAPNFIHWMVDICDRCSDGFAQKAFADNIDCEVRERHPEMLRKFVSQLPPSAPERQHTYEESAEWFIKVRLQFHIDNITALTKKDNSVDGLVVAAALENASLEFIPWMEKVGQKLGFTDFTYTNKHGESDKDHAVDLAKAVSTQAQAMGITPSQLAQNETLREVKRLLYNIFRSGI